MNNRIKNLKWNSVLALCYQAILIITGLILPRFFLHYYGSEINGLISSVAQFLSFINICDLGISAVVSSAYYKPLAENDTKQISKVFVYSKRFFRIVAVILVVYIAVLLIVYPVFINHTFDFWFTFTLIAAMGISQLGQYFIGISYQLLLNSDQKSYVQLVINGSTLLLNTVVCIVLMMSGANVQIVKLSTSIIYLLRPVLMRVYVKSKYKLDYSVPVDASAVSQKKNGIIQHLAYMVYENTDIMILTMFSSLTNVSIYSIYALITNSIRQIIMSSTTGFQAFLGNIIAKNEKEELKKVFHFYSWGVHTVSTLLFTITGLLIVPFVQIYTSNVGDANYNVPVFGILITAAYYLSTIRNNYYVLIRAAGHYKQTQAASILEAVLNLVISIVMVFQYGLIGVALGTIIATAFFIAYEMLYFSKHIVFEKIWFSLKRFLIDIASSGFSIAIAAHLRLFQGTVVSWMVQAVVVSALCGLICLLFQFVFYRSNIKRVKEALCARFKH